MKLNIYVYIEKKHFLIFLNYDIVKYKYKIKFSGLKIFNKNQYNYFKVNKNLFLNKVFKVQKPTSK